MLIRELDHGAPGAGILQLKAVVLAALLQVRLLQGRRQERLARQGQVEVADVGEQAIIEAPALAEGAHQAEINLLGAVFSRRGGEAGIIFQHTAGVDAQPWRVAQAGAHVDVVIAKTAGAIGHLRAQGVGGQVPAADFEGLAGGQSGKMPGERIGKKGLAGNAFDRDQVEVGAAGQGIVKAEPVIEQMHDGGRGGEEGTVRGQTDAAAVEEKGAGQPAEKIAGRAIIRNQTQRRVGIKGGHGLSRPGRRTAWATWQRICGRGGLPRLQLPGLRLPGLRLPGLGLRGLRLRCISAPGRRRQRWPGWRRRGAQGIGRGRWQPGLGLLGQRGGGENQTGEEEQNMAHARSISVG